MEAEYFKNNMQDTLLDGKKLFIDWDAGFIEGRQYIRKHKVIFNSKYILLYKFYFVIYYVLGKNHWFSYISGKFFILFRLN